MKVKYIHLKPTRQNILSLPPGKRRKSPYIVLTFEDGSTRTIKVQFCDLRKDADHALETAENIENERKDLMEWWEIIFFVVVVVIGIVLTSWIREKR